MLHFSNGKHRHFHRHNVLDLCTNMNARISSSHGESTFTSNSSVESFASDSPLTSKFDVNSYNSKCLRNFRKNGISITPDDIYQLRRELQIDYALQRSVAERKRCLREACAALFELQSELQEESRRGTLIDSVLSFISTIGSAMHLGWLCRHHDISRRSYHDCSATLSCSLYNVQSINDSSISHFVFEYQAFLCWIYTTIRFADFATGMERHFLDMKEHHRILLSVLAPCSESFILAILRFSQMCVEYAAMCDEEALQWCRLAYVGNAPREVSASDTIRSLSSLSSSSSSSDVDEILSRRDSERICSMLEDLRRNISEIEHGMASTTSGYTGEKLIH
ncbi:hypothetical protein DICVIV_02831 [Dictyocaulus viviparus]|uniref:Uncharacterized protein n=1 Tax=Dictyocaulus viviparus TaxID=29172 RepID=A0A0D8Y278_DICVI|nr:hypothetical protein DICVIV_02831 [Dictyocaulus viviparus]